MHLIPVKLKLYFQQPFIFIFIDLWFFENERESPKM